LTGEDRPSRGSAAEKLGLDGHFSFTDEVPAWMEVTTRLQSQLWVSGLAPLLHRELANKAPFTGTLKGAASK
jgi:hypothetical protein